MSKRPVAPEPNSVLTTSEVADWIRKSPRTVERLFVSFLPGRYLAAHVLTRIEELRRERANTAPESDPIATASGPAGR